MQTTNSHIARRAGPQAQSQPCDECGQPNAARRYCPKCRRRLCRTCVKKRCEAG